MRIRVSFKNPTTNDQENYMLNIPKDVETVIDLEKYLFKKLNLGESHLLFDYRFKLNINGYQLIETDKIEGLIFTDDLLE